MQPCMPPNSKRSCRHFKSHVFLLMWFGLLLSVWVMERSRFRSALRYSLHLRSNFSIPGYHDKPTIRAYRETILFVRIISPSLGKKFPKSPDPATIYVGIEISQLHLVVSGYKELASMRDTSTLEGLMAQWHQRFIESLRQKQRSPTTITGHDAAIRAFLHWFAEQSDSPPASSLSLDLFERYIAYLRDEHIRIQELHQGMAPETGGRRSLKHSTIHAYIGVLIRWLQWLINEGEPAFIAADPGRTMGPRQLKDHLEQMVDPPRPPVAARIPDLRRLPGYYELRLRAFLAPTGTPPQQSGPMRRTYLNLLQSRALIAVLFASGGRINDVLNLDVGMVQQEGRIMAMVPRSETGRKQHGLRLDALARTWIAEYLAARSAAYPDAEALFISHGPKANGKRLSDSSAWRIVIEAATWLADLRRREGADMLEVVALQSVTPRSLRHFLAQSLLDAGAGYDAVAELLGHSSIAVTELVYGRPGAEATQEFDDVLAPRAILPKLPHDKPTD